MDAKKYLNRIGFNGIPLVNEETLIRLHELHVLTIPFGNMDIHFNRQLLLQQDHLFDKIIMHRREGFCYELNYLFHCLLTELGFKNKMISSRIFTSDGFAGPELDHLSLVARINKKQWLVDVGFGDLFIRPLEVIKDKIQFDGRNYFKIESDQHGGYTLLMSSDNETFEKKYSFSLKARSIQEFESACYDKQINPNSYFVQNRICTRPTKHGRITIFNNKFVEKKNAEKRETIIEDDHHLQQLLRKEFGMLLQIEAHSGKL
jgi:N-hydroxyarylamine O-acetyltransferase